MTRQPMRRNFTDGLLLINGNWQAAVSGATMEITDPTTETVISQVAKAGLPDVDAAISAAGAAFADGRWSSMGLEQRAKVLFRAADLLDERAEDFALREAMDMGMPYHDFLNVIMPHCSGLFRYFGGVALSAMNGSNRESYEADVRILTRRQPLGVVAAITPFNFPLALSCSKIAPALAAGNCVIHKPASDTPLTALALGQVLTDAGLPRGVYNLLTGPGREIGDALVRDPRVHKIAFTGSTVVGQGITRDGSASLKHLTMELGGKSPNIIFADADLNSALQTAFWGIFWNKGEVCVAGSRILVERSIYPEFVERLAHLAQNAVIGDPLSSDTMIGPMASRSEYDKVLQYIEKGKTEASLVAGGGTRNIAGKGLFIEPTVFADVSNDAMISREEIFGPVVPVIPFKNEDEAIVLANSTPYGLAAGIQTGDLGRGIRLADRIDAGTVWLNCWHKYHPNAPFGGFKMSGYGREQGVEAFESYTQYKTVWANLASR